MTQFPYPKKVEDSMEMHYKSLNEKQKRLYLWAEAIKLWRWGKQYIRKLFGCSINTVIKWLSELQQTDTWGSDKKRIRKYWWWDKKRTEKNAKIIPTFEKVVADKTAWSPVDPDIKWTNLRPKEIVEEMKQEWVEVSVYIVKQIIEVKNMKKRKLHKGKTLKSVEWRNEQFENIKKIKEEAEKQGNPVISTDTKKKNF